MVRTLANSSNRGAARRRALRLRAWLVAVLLALATVGTAGCGDPDDDDGGGGGYVAAHLTVPDPAPGVP
ncbi:hypothetical protein [Blastococcus goldschmidtiae]|uniref:Uncharacterized protein n=1 Tax=Blastococcus goldschmidtiae TaxID=3075546 RepID=A0ABU2KBM1_9ACTN|nr:hypothetical protein [Blastococcus sp. DSM 46792]MDT0277576.1 hypothetical protein [Blastococcus sp. DSM 46792]